jgi:hypothetical protein
VQIWRLLYSSHKSATTVSFPLIFFAKSNRICIETQTATNGAFDGHFFKMSAQSIEDDVALPHASLLAYFRPTTSTTGTPAHESTSPPPPYVRDTSDVAYSPITTLYKVHDEESQYGFWGERASSEDECEGMRLRLVKRDHQGFYSFCCFWCAVLVCMISGVGIIFTTDLALSSLGFGTGFAKWMVDASANAGGESYNVSRRRRLVHLIRLTQGFVDALLPCLSKSRSPRSTDMAPHQPRRRCEVQDGRTHAECRVHGALEAAR